MRWGLARERWRAGKARSRPRSPRPAAGAADARLDAVITTAAMDEVGKSAWCREHGVFRADLDTWRATATAALGVAKATRASASGSVQDRQRIKELERNLLRKDRALAETAALLVLSKKVGAIFNTGEGAWSPSTIAQPWPSTSTRRMRPARVCILPAKSPGSTCAPCNAGSLHPVWWRVTDGRVRSIRHRVMH